MSGHAILKNLYEKKMDVILTISFKIKAEIEIRTFLRPTSQTRCIGSVKHYVFTFVHCHEMRLHCFFNPLSIAFLNPKILGFLSLRKLAQHEK